MPNVTLYIRQEDYEKWKIISNKSELVSQAINRSVITANADGKTTTQKIANVDTPAAVSRKEPNLVLPTTKKRTVWNISNDIAAAEHERDQLIEEAEQDPETQKKIWNDWENTLTTLRAELKEAQA